MRPISNKGKHTLHGSPLSDVKPLHSRKVTQMTFFGNGIRIFIKKTISLHSREVTQMTFFGNDHDYKKGFYILGLMDFLTDRSLMDKDLIS